MDGVHGCNVYLYSIVRDFCGGGGIFAKFTWLLYVSWVGILTRKLYRAPNCDNLFLAATFVDARRIHGNIKCRNGGLNDLDFA